MLCSFLHYICVFICKSYLVVRRELYRFGMPPKIGDERVIISLTSWSKRINNVPIVIDSILNNTIKPDKIVLNLSLEEFPNRENDLPQDIVNLQDCGTIEIGWQEGNTKAFKKIIPTLKKYPNDAIIAIDDDFYYPTDFIQTFVDMHKKFPKNPLCGNRIEIKGVKAHCGCSSLVKAEYFGCYIDKLYSNDIVKYRMDDVLYTYCAEMNRCHYLYVGKEFNMNMPQINPIDGISDEYTDKYNTIMEEYLIKEIKSLFGINIKKLNEPIFSF